MRGSRSRCMRMHALCIISILLCDRVIHVVGTVLLVVLLIWHRSMCSVVVPFPFCNTASRKFDARKLISLALPLALLQFGLGLGLVTSERLEVCHGDGHVAIPLCSEVLDEEVQERLLLLIALDAQLSTRQLQVEASFHLRVAVQVAPVALAFAL